MAAKNVDIKINTTASGTGAKQTEDGLKKVGDEAEKSSKKRISAEERAALKAEQAAQKAADAAVREEQRKTAATQAEAAKRVKAEQKAQAQVEQATAKSSSRRSQMAGQVGLQAQDIAVQAQMGTSAVTILAQQGTQIASIFGPQGAIVGALIGVGAVAAKVFYDMAVASAVTGEAMEDMSDKLKEAFSASAAKSINEYNAKMKESTSFAQTLRNAELQLKEARDQRAASDARLIDSQLKLDEAAINYLQSTGQIVKAEEKLLVVRQQAAEATKNAQIEEANKEVERQRALYRNIVEQRKDVDAEVQEAKKKMAQLEAQQARLAPIRSLYQQKDNELIKAGVFKEGFQSVRTQTATGELDVIAKQIQDLYKIIEEKPRRIAAIADQAMEQAGEVDSAIETAKIQINEINQKFNLTTKAQALGAATESISKGAAEIVKGVDEIEAVTPLQQQAKEAIKQAASDGIINAQDQVLISGNLRTLMSSLKTGQEGNLKTLRELLTLNDTIGAKMQSLSNEISGLKQKINNITVR
jgi:hypothetical protein